MHEQGQAAKSTLDAHRLSYNKKALQLEQAQANLRLLKNFDHPKKLRQFEAALEEAKEELVRVKLQGQSKGAQCKAELETQKKILKLNQSGLVKINKQLRASKVYAPRGGLVVYPTRRSRASSEPRIEEGAMVWNRQELIKLPDTAKLKVGIKVHESHVNQVEVGQQAFVVLDSKPGARFRAVVKKVARLPDTRSHWSNPDLKVYDTEVLIQDAIPNVKPGVSARVEIVITNLVDVLTVPIQSVTRHNGQLVCFVTDGQKAKPVPVEAGLLNNKFIEIRTGLEEGDRVLLSPPFNPDDKDLGGAIIPKAE